MSASVQPSCDRAAAQSETPCRQVAHPNLVLATTILASSLAFIDGSVVNVGLPAIGRTLYASAADLQWIINAYLLPLSALLLFGGALGDRIGRRRALICGVLLFAAASSACAFAPSLTWLLAGRAAQGMGAALLMPNSLAILGASFTGEAKGRAIGIWAATGVTGAALGPVAGGWLIDGLGWRAIFLINLPIALACVALAWSFVHDAVDAARSRLDLAGAVLATASLGALTWGLTIGTGPNGWTDTALIAIAAGAISLLVFLWAEQRQGELAMMPLALFAAPSFVGITLLTLLLYGALGGLLVLLPTVLIRAAHYSATAAGAALLPFPLLIATTSPYLGALAGRIGSRIPLTAGPLAVATGFLLLARSDPTGRYWVSILPAMLVIALGMAGAVAPLTTAVLTSVDSRHSGTASGFNSAVARTGGLVATALLGSVLAAGGSELITGFHVVATCCAVAALAASAAAFALIAR
jgi:EmrB/QacA subfamily drug resistance transporter